MNFANKNTYNLSYLFLTSIRNKIALHEELYAKYSLTGMYRILNRKIYYKKPNRFFPDIYRNASIYFHLSLFFEEITNKNDFSFLFSSRVNAFKENLKTMILKSGKVRGANNSQIIGGLLHKNGTHSQFVDRLSSRTKLQSRESDTLQPLSVPLKYSYNAGSQSNIVDSNKRHQRIKLTTGNKVHGVDTRVITSFPVWSLPQSARTITIAQESSITSVVYAQSSVLKETASNSHNNVFTSTRILLDQTWLKRMHTTATTLTTISEREVSTPTVSIPQNVHLTRDTQPPLSQWPAPVIKQNLLDVTRGTTVHSHTARITNATHPFTVVCRVGRMEPPQLSYAFAQPMRPIVQDEQAVVKVHEKEIVKVVQREVQSHMSSDSVVKRLSRADYAHIANNVYSSLARQLVVDRERLGI